VWLNNTKAKLGGGEPQVEQRRIKDKIKNNLIAARPSPYFGRLDFESENETGIIKTYYIGRYWIPLDHVFSWDTSLAELYRNNNSNEYEFTYKHKNGSTERRTIRGMVTLRRALTVKSCELLDYTNTYLLSAADTKPQIVSAKESPLTKALAKGKTDQMKDIVETLQPDQYEKIRADLEQTLIINGVAGSGKSEIGVHRLAYLLSPQREEQLRPDEVILFGPSQMFLAYISMVLPGLNMPRIRQMTVSDWLKGTLSHRLRWSARDLIQERVMNELSKDLERLIQAERIKSTFKMANVLENHVKILQKQFYRNITDVIIGGRIVLKGIELKRVVRNTRRDHLNEIRVELLETIRREARRKITGFTESYLTSKIESEINRFWPFVDFADEYFTLIADEDRLAAAAKTKLTEKEISNLVAFGTKLGKNKTTDLPSMCYLDHLLNNRIMGDRNNRMYSHIVVDEAQDVSPLALRIMQLHSRNNSFSILGDTAQHVLPYKGIIGWQEIQKLFLKKSTRMLKAPFTYRSTFEITSYYREVLKAIDPSALKPRPYRRHGEKVQFIRSKNRKEGIQSIADDIQQLLDDEFQKIAVLCRTGKEATDMQKMLRHRGITECALLDDQTLSDSRLIVSSILSTRGLEFDAVLITNASSKHYPPTDIDNRLLYLAITRAAHSLHIHWYGSIANILAVPGFYDKAMQTIQKTKEKKRASKKRKSESETVASCDKSEITVGIVDLKEWPGPLTCQFNFVKEHFNVVRYRCLLGKRYFDFYVPRYALDDLDLEKIPNQLKVIIWNSGASSASSIHFSGLSNIHESEVIEYGFNREMANYQLYELNHEGQTYSLYIPKAVFGDLPYPERVSLRMVVAPKG
ncbi:HelD family protein, partial [Chloroflexota bacterium]